MSVLHAFAAYRAIKAAKAKEQSKKRIKGKLRPRRKRDRAAK